MEPVFFEKILLKFFFTDEKVRDKVMPFLSPEIFDDFNNVRIIKTIIEHTEKFEKFPTVSEMRVSLEKEETYNQLVEIMDMDISEYSNEFLLEEIEEFFRKKLIHNINVDVAMALNNDKMDEIKISPDRLREAISFSFDTKIGLDVFEEEELLYDFLHNKDFVIPSGIYVLDKVISGGFHEKTLTLFLAETNMGKSLIMTSLAVNSVLQNKNVLYITCEMSENKISERIMTNMFDISIEDLKLLNREAFHQKFEHMRTQSKRKIVIKEYPPKSINMNHIRNVIKELEVRKKFKADIIYLDYLGIMNPISKNKADNSYLEIKRVSEEVRALAVELAIPIVSAVQTNRKGFGDAEIDLTDISDSIGTAATADIIVGVTQSEELRGQGKYSWIILKNRYGLNKKAMTVIVNYYKMRIEDDPDGTPCNTSRNFKDPPHPNDKKNIVDNAIDDTNNIINRDLKSKRNKMFGNDGSFDEIII